MQFGNYRFKCTLQRDAILPEYKGSTFRGGFGVALKKVCCTVRNNDCASELRRDKTAIENGKLIIDNEGQKLRTVIFTCLRLLGFSLSIVHCQLSITHYPFNYICGHGG